MAVTTQSHDTQPPSASARSTLVVRVFARLAEAIGSAEARAFGTDTPRLRGS